MGPLTGVFCLVNLLVESLCSVDPLFHLIGVGSVPSERSNFQADVQYCTYSKEPLTWGIRPDPGYLASLQYYPPPGLKSSRDILQGIFTGYFDPLIPRFSNRSKILETWLADLLCLGCPLNRGGESMDKI
jgi:hypothetical protein